MKVYFRTGGSRHLSLLLGLLLASGAVGCGDRAPRTASIMAVASATPGTSVSSGAAPFSLRLLATALGGASVDLAARPGWRVGVTVENGI